MELCPAELYGSLANMTAGATRQNCPRSKLCVHPAAVSALQSLPLNSTVAQEAEHLTCTCAGLLKALMADCHFSKSKSILREQHKKHQAAPVKPSRCSH